MGGSQLSQLKSTLRESGLSRTSSPKNPKKRAKQRKDLSSTSLAHRNAKFDAIGKQFNRFDVREEKSKFEVVTRQGRMEKGAKGAPTKSRTAGIELRKKTLLPMLDSRSHVSTFVDRRFGEASSHLTPEEKALERFTAERQARLNAPPGGKKARFNLEDEGDDDDDGDEEGDALTHGGRKLGFGDEEELEHGGWGGLGAAVEGGASSSNREPLLRRRMAATAAEDDDDDEDAEPERKKTHAEIMDEVVAKSKMHKHERQRVKSADDETRHALDAELKDLRALLGGTGRMPRPPVLEEARASKDVKGKAPATADHDEGEDDSEEEDEDEEDEEDSDEEGESDEEGSTYSLNDEELEAALAVSNKPGVDRELLRKLVGGGDSDTESEPEDKGRSAPAPTYDLGDDDAPRPVAAPVEKDADPYDSYVRMLALEPRGKPTDRLKTPLELAQDAAEELKKREDKRLKRQRGEDDDSDEEGQGEKKNKKGKRLPQADDLEDDYFREQAEGSDAEVDEEAAAALGKGLEGETFTFQESDAEEGDEGEEDDDDDDEEDDEDEEEGDLDAADFEDESESDEDAEAPESLVKPIPKEIAPRKWGGEDVKRELPFTFPCPSTHAEFVKLLAASGIEEQDTATVVKRIRTLYHPGLGASNKEKLQVFTHVLIDHALYLASSPSPTAFTTINSLLPSLLTLSHAYALTTAPHYVSKLTLMQKNFVRGVSKGPLDPATQTWPGPAELTLLRLIGMTWSTSDLSHPVAAPAMLLISQYLAQARIRSLRDIAAGLFLCTLASQYETLSKRLVPEALNFLQNSFLVLLPTVFTTKSAPGTFPLPDFGQEHVKGLRLRSSEALEPSPTLNFVSTLTEIEDDDAQAKVDLAATTVRLLSDYAEKYIALDAFIELFEPVEQIVSKALTKSSPESLKIRLLALQTSLRRMLKLSRSTRQPLLMQHHKPIPIATFIPKFDEGFNPNRRFDPDTDRNEANKLRALLKKEKKGAVRELRKDNRFLAAEEGKRKAEADRAYESKIRKIMGGLADERAEEKREKSSKEKSKKVDKARRGKK